MIPYPYIEQSLSNPLANTSSFATTYKYFFITNCNSVNRKVDKLAKVVFDYLVQPSGKPLFFLKKTLDKVERCNLNKMVKSVVRAVFLFFATIAFIPFVVADSSFKLTFYLVDRMLAIPNILALKAKDRLWKYDFGDRNAWDEVKVNLKRGIIDFLSLLPDVEQREVVEQIKEITSGLSDLSNLKFLTNIVEKIYINASERRSVLSYDYFCSSKKANRFLQKELKPFFEKAKELITKEISLRDKKQILNNLCEVYKLPEEKRALFLQIYEPFIKEINFDPFYPWCRSFIQEMLKIPVKDRQPTIQKINPSIEEVGVSSHRMEKVAFLRALMPLWPIENYEQFCQLSIPKIKQKYPYSILSFIASTPSKKRKQLVLLLDECIHVLKQKDQLLELQRILFHILQTPVLERRCVLELIVFFVQRTKKEVEIQSILSLVSLISANERKQIVNLVLPFVESISKDTIKAILQAQEEISSEEWITTLALLFTEGVSDNGDITIALNLIKEISPDEREGIVKLTTPFLKNVSKEEDRLDLLDLFLEIPKNKRSQVVMLAMPLIKKKTTWKGKLVTLLFIWSIIDQIPESLYCTQAKEVIKTLFFSLKTKNDHYKSIEQTQDELGNTLLHIACVSEVETVQQIFNILGYNQRNDVSEEIFKLMMMKNKDGDTPFHYFCENHTLAEIKGFVDQFDFSSEEIVKMFAEKNNQQQTALHLIDCINETNIFFLSQILQVIPKEKRYRLLIAQDDRGNTFFNREGTVNVSILRMIRLLFFLIKLK